MKFVITMQATIINSMYGGINVNNLDSKFVKLSNNYIHVGQIIFSGIKHLLTCGMYSL